jgi:hypothetical protein
MVQTLFFVSVGDEGGNDQTDEQTHDQADGRMFDETSHYQSHDDRYYDHNIPSTVHSV